MNRRLAALLCVLAALLWRPALASDNGSVVRSEGVVSGVEAGAVSDVKEMALQLAIKKAIGSELDALMKRESVVIDPSITQSVGDHPMDYVLNYRVVSEEWRPLTDQPPAPPAADGGRPTAAQTAPKAEGAKGAEAPQATGAAPVEQKDQAPRQALQPSDGLQTGRPPVAQAPAQKEQLPQGVSRPEGGRDTGQAPQPQQARPSAEVAPQAAIVGEYRVEVEVSVDSARLRALVTEALSGAGTSEVAIRIVDVTDYSAYRSILDSLARIALIKEVSYGSFSRGRITLSVKTAAASDMLLERIVREIGDRCSVEADGRNTITIRPLNGAPAQIGRPS